MNLVDSKGIWDGDLLDRKSEAIYLQRYIENAFNMDKANSSSLVLNINSEWGSGKTWFLERLAKELQKNHSVIYFDSWANDFTKDALMSFVSTVCKELETQFDDELKIKGKVSLLKQTAYRFIKPSIPVLLSALVRHFVGVNLIQETDDQEPQDGVASIKDVAATLTGIAASSAIESFHKEKDAVDSFKRTLIGLIECLKSPDTKQHLPICIFIDELDRCRPTYAIELLESIKHLFNIEGIFFIIASDTKQLAHSIKVVYGQDFNATGYLKRFFYSEYCLSSPDHSKITEFLFYGFNFGDKLFLPESINKSDGVKGVFSKISYHFKLTVREQEQGFSILKNCILVTEKKEIHAIPLFYLIFMRLKLESYYEDIKNNLNGSTYKDIVKSNYSKGVLKSISFDTILVNDGSGSYSDTSIFDVMQFYLSIADGNRDSLRINFEDPYLQYQEEIVSNLKKYYRNKDDKQIITTNNIGSYFDLLDQAGRIIS